MASPEVLLVFPPIVYTNFGRYYPSTAMLAAYLARASVPTDQWDLNQLILERVLEPRHLDRLLAGESETLLALSTSEGDITLDPRLKALLAARAMRSRPGCFRDPAGRLIQAGHPLAPTEVLAALAHGYYMDPPLEELISPAFWERSQVRAFEDYLEESGVLDSLPRSVHTIGISIPMGPQLPFALILARAFRRRHDVCVVVGGPTVTLLDRHSLEKLLRAHRDVTAAVQYQGEVPLLELARHFGAGARTPWEVPGVLALDRDAVRGSAGVAVSRKLDDLPFGLYKRELLDRLAKPEISIRQAEGCYWGQCAYCDYVELYPKSAGRYRPQPVRRLVDEMRHHIETYAVRDFCLITEAIPPRVGRDMAQEILDRGLDVEWNSFAMVDERFDAQILRTMAKSGCSHLVIGVETVNDRVLKLVRKKATRSMTVRFLNDCREAGIRLIVNLIPNLPTTTYREAMEALDVVTEQLDCVTGISVFPFEATRSSDIGRSPETFGLRVVEGGSGLTGQAEFCANHLPVRDEAMSTEELDRVLDRYRKVAALAGGGKADPSAECDPNFEREDELWKFDETYVELMVADGDQREIGSLVFNWLTGRMAHFPPFWSPIFRWLRDAREVSSGQIARQVGIVTGLVGIERDAVAGFVLRRIQDQGLIGRRSPLSGTPETHGGASDPPSGRDRLSAGEGTVRPGALLARVSGS